MISCIAYIQFTYIAFYLQLKNIYVFCVVIYINKTNLYAQKLTKC